MMRLFRVVFAASDLFAFASVSVAAVDDLNGWARRTAVRNCIAHTEKDSLLHRNVVKIINGLRMASSRGASKSVMIGLTQKHRHTRAQDTGQRNPRYC